MRLPQWVKGFGASGAVAYLMLKLNAVLEWTVFLFIAEYGNVWGGVLFATQALLWNYLFLMWYKRSKIDFFGFELLKMKENAESKSLGGKWVRIFLRIGVRPLAYIGLSIWEPIYGVMYLRGKEGGLSFSRKDWFWFWVSNTIGIGSWIFFAIGGVEGIRKIWMHLKPLWT